MLLSYLNSAGAGLPLRPRRVFFHLTEIFCSRESELFFLRVFSRCVYRPSLSAGAGLPLRPGQALPFLTKRKEAKIRQRGEFRFSPPWNPHSTTKGAAFGNREKLPLWFCSTHRHGLRVKQVHQGGLRRPQKGTRSCCSVKHHLQIDKSKLPSGSPLRANESALKMPADGRKR